MAVRHLSALPVPLSCPRGRARGPRRSARLPASRDKPNCGRPVGPGGVPGRLTETAHARQRPTADRLRRFAEEHLLYEAGMLYEVTGKLMNRHHEEDPVVENTLLESFGVHNRNLIDFLWLTADEAH